MDPVVIISVEGLEAIAEESGRALRDVELVAQRAINRTADLSRTRLARRVTGEVAIRASDVSPSGKKLYVSRRAGRGSLEAVITASGSTTPLAKFAGSQMRPKVRVKRASVARYIPRSFKIDLRNGNTGLAVRTGGEPPQGALKPKAIGKNLWLLYGPSVDQILSGTQPVNGGVFGDEEAWIAAKLEAEFWRLMEVEF